MLPEDIKNASEEELRNRLAELKAMKRSPERLAKDPEALDAERLRARANAMMKHDPETAQNWLEKARELDIRANSKRDPDTVRFKIQSAINSVRGELMNMTSEDPRRKGMQKLLDALIAELQLDAPSIQHAYTVANKGPAVPGPGPDPQVVKTSTDYINEINSAERGATQAIVDAAAAYGIKGDELDRVKAAAEAREKKLAPKTEPKRPSETSKEVIAQVNNQLKFLLAGNLASGLDPSQPGNKQKIFKLGQRAFSDEAVNVGDVGLTKGWVEQVLSNITGITGEISQEEIQSSLNTIRANYNKALQALKVISSDDPNSDYFASVSKAGAAGVKQALADNPWVNRGASTTESNVQTDKLGRKYTVDANGSRVYQTGGK